MQGVFAIYLYHWVQVFKSHMHLSLSLSLTCIYDDNERKEKYKQITRPINIEKNCCFFFNKKNDDIDAVWRFKKGKNENKIIIVIHESCRPMH